jgi:dihydroxy-acid dehydratase
MAELNRAGLLHKDCYTVSGKDINDVISENDIMDKKCSDYAIKRSLSAPCGVRNLVAYSQDNYYKELDKDRKEGCIRTIDNAYNKEGGLAVLFGNIAEKGCIVKTAGVDESIYNFKGKVKVFDSQDSASEAILSDKIEKGDIVVIRYEGPKGGPGMQEMLYPTTYLKSKKLDKDCALLTDGRFSGGTAGLSIGHVSPEAANGGLIGLVENGDIIEISIPERRIQLMVSDDVIAKRKENLLKAGGFKPKRERNISYALKLYSLFATSADMGAVRDLDKIDRILKNDH